MLKALRAAAGVGVLLVLGCINGPYNGTTHSGSVINVSFPVSGHHVSPNAQVEVQVLSSPTADPIVSGNWTTIGTATSSATGSDYHGDMLYPWSTSIIPVPNVLYAARWPVGGLVKVRALMHGSGTSVQAGYAFDEVSWSDCATSEYLSGTPGQDATRPGLSGWPEVRARSALSNSDSASSENSDRVALMLSVPSLPLLGYGPRRERRGEPRALVRRG
jgi:hypothetical protein